MFLFSVSDPSSEASPTCSAQNLKLYQNLIVTIKWSKVLRSKRAIGLSKIGLLRSSNQTSFFIFSYRFLCTHFFDFVDYWSAHRLQNNQLVLMNLVLRNQHFCQFGQKIIENVKDFLANFRILECFSLIGVRLFYFRRLHSRVWQISVTS